jgi:hypothetical protein
MSTRAKNHHYVPKFYLEKFTNDEGFLSIYDDASSSFRRQRPKEVMKINSYYRQEWAPEGIDKNILESTLGEWLESESKHAIDKLLLEPKQLNEKDLANLILYLAVQRVRVPRQVAAGKALMHELILNLSSSEISKELTSGRFTLVVKDSARFEVMRHSLDAFSTWFESMEWEVISAEEGASFVTTDSPISFYNVALKPPAEAGIGLAGTIVLFPISSSKALLIRHPMYSKGDVNPLLALPIPERKDGNIFISISSGAVWEIDAVDNFNWKMSQLNSTLVVANSDLVIKRCLNLLKTDEP